MTPVAPAPSADPGARGPPRQRDVTAAPAARRLPRRPLVALRKVPRAHPRTPLAAATLTAAARATSPPLLPSERYLYIYIYMYICISELQSYLEEEEAVDKHGARVIRARMRGVAIRARERAHKRAGPVALAEVLHRGDSGHGSHGQHHECIRGDGEGVAEEEDEVFLIILTHAVVHPGAVVVHLKDAPVALRAVVCARRLVPVAAVAHRHGAAALVSHRWRWAVERHCARVRRHGGQVREHGKQRENAKDGHV
mmetsp:Transcript_39518/g.91513  ORF Transcript_39518/g.91513 Transcript_39518/m.91513 type:complete len:254 (-) Transcript_39518:256-1017(-)